MPAKSVSAPRCVALVGPYLSGKTTLLEALLSTCGAIHRRSLREVRWSRARPFRTWCSPRRRQCPHVACARFRDHPWTLSPSMSSFSRITNPARAAIDTVPGERRLVACSPLA